MNAKTTQLKSGFASSGTEFYFKDRPLIPEQMNRQVYRGSSGLSFIFSHAPKQLRLNHFLQNNSLKF
jgi:hypothetical protein